MSDKVRYYLEQSVGELQDLRKRGIFSESELKSVIKRRTEYEHRLVSRGVKPADFLAYANYEISLDKLRSLRLKRLKKDGSVSGTGNSDWAGSRRITFIFDRATKRLPQHLQLWMKLIDYAKSKNSVHVVNKALTSMLRLHPTNPSVWVYVAKYQAEENAAMQEARVVLQRGLRFNRESQYLWVQYMRLELIYVAKILARRELLGITSARAAEVAEQGSTPSALDLSTDDVSAAESELKNLPDVNVDILGDVSSNPALRGDVALAIFDASISNIPDTELRSYYYDVLNLFDDFHSLDRQYLSNHVIQSALSGKLGASPEVQLWKLTLPVRHTSLGSGAMPDQLKLMFNLYSKMNNRSEVSPQLKELIRGYLTWRFLSPGQESNSVEEPYFPPVEKTERESEKPAPDGPLVKAIELFISRL